MLLENNVVEVKDSWAKKVEDAETQLSLKNKTMNTTSNHVIKKDVEDKNQENQKSLRTLLCDEQDHQGKEEKTKLRWLKEVKSRVSLQLKVLCSSRPPGNYCDKRNGAKRESPAVAKGEGCHKLVH